MLPEITHLQFAVLHLLDSGEMSGIELRDQLMNGGIKHSRAAFYQLMARLEESGFVNGRYEQKVVGDVTVTERFYLLTVQGRQVYHTTANFYGSRQQLGLVT